MLNVTAELDSEHSDLFSRAKRLLDEIEHSVLPSDPEKAFELLTEFVGHHMFDAHDGRLESSITQLLIRAVDLAAIAAERAPLTPRPQRSLIN